MKYIKKDVDRTLLVLIIFFLVLFLFFTAYYEAALRKTLNLEGQNSRKLSEITAQSILEKLNATDNVKKYALIDKAVLEEKYNELVIQHENLKKEKTKLEEELTLLKSQMEYQKAKIEGPVIQFRLIQEKNEEIKELKNKIDALCSMLKEDGSSVAECQ